MRTWYSANINVDRGTVTVIPWELPDGTPPQGVNAFESAEDAWNAAERQCIDDAAMYGNAVRKAADDLRAAQMRAAKSTTLLAVAVHGRQQWLRQNQRLELPETGSASDASWTGEDVP